MSSKKNKLADILTECSSPHQDESERVRTNVAINSYALQRIHVIGGHRWAPLCHTALPVYTEHSGGSSKLITVLNRLGMASSETLDTHIVKVSAQHKQEGL